MLDLPRFGEYFCPSGQISCWEIDRRSCEGLISDTHAASLRLFRDVHVKFDQPLKLGGRDSSSFSFRSGESSARLSNIAPCGSRVLKSEIFITHSVLTSQLTLARISALRRGHSASGGCCSLSSRGADDNTGYVNSIWSFHARRLDDFILEPDSDQRTGGGGR